jgi:hypothetical protein
MHGCWRGVCCDCEQRVCCNFRHMPAVTGPTVASPYPQHLALVCMPPGAGLAQLRQGGLTSTDQILVAEKAGAWSEALALYEQALSQEAAATAALSNPPAQAAATAAAGVDSTGGAVGDRTARRRPGEAAADVLIDAVCAVVSGGNGSSGAQSGQHRLSTWMGLGNAGHARALSVQDGSPAGADGTAGGDGAGEGLEGLLGAGHACVSNLQVGHLRCLLQMGHQQTLLRQVDGLMARCLSQASAAATAAAVTPAQAAGQQHAGAEATLQAVQQALGQLAALGVAAAWRLGAWDQLRGYLSVVEASSNSPAGLMRPLPAADRWEVGAEQSKAQVCQRWQHRVPKPAVA